uniref:Putative lipocalin n=1 Tax=Rhipicephalus microplus TaxID=6941 RepID=A0A6G5A447_RHIMP
MKGSELLIVVLVSAHFTTLQCKWNIAEKTYAMKKFLNTSFPIWTIYTTRGSKRRCEVDVKHYITRNSIEYHHFFTEGHQRNKVIMEGVFDKNKRTE